MRLTIALFSVALICPFTATAADWTVPAAGNIYQTSPKPGRTNTWTNADVVHSAYVHVDRPATLKLSITAGAGGTSQIETRIEQQKFRVTIGRSTKKRSEEHTSELQSQD